MNLFSPKDFDSTEQQSSNNAEVIIPLLEERLVVKHYRRKIGEVIIRKVIETRMVEVPMRREKIIVEQINPEYKQLVAIDLGEEQVDVSDEMIALEVAQQFLKDFAKQPGYEKAKVKIIFEDSQLQLTYQQFIRNFEG